jgi:hypothetical protein
MLDTRSRVPAQTQNAINERIRAETARSVRYFEKRADEIQARLSALDEEWDIERAIEANASALALFGVLMVALRGNNRWLVLPMAVTGFLLQHAIQGWCPPVPVLRRLGFRTSYEIEEERQALKALRGDFKLEDAPDRAAAALDAARA